MEEAARQLSRRSQATERNAGQGARQPRQEELPLEVYGADAVLTALHEQPQKADRLAALPRSPGPRRAGAPHSKRSRPAFVRQRRQRRRLLGQAQELRAADRHRP